MPLLRLSLLWAGRPERSSTSAYPSDQPGPDPWPSSTLGLPRGVLGARGQTTLEPGPLSTRREEEKIQALL